MVIKNALLHSEAQRHRLLALNAGQAQDIMLLTAALRELHAILSERSSGTTDACRLQLARSHVVRTLARHGTFPVKAGMYGRAL